MSGPGVIWGISDQDFLTLNPTYPYIAVNDLPKVEALERLFPDVYRAEPVLVSAGRVSN